MEGRFGGSVRLSGILERGRFGGGAALVAGWQAAFEAVRLGGTPERARFGGRPPWWVHRSGVRFSVSALWCKPLVT